MIGHSLGEIAAAVVAGALSLDDGARIAAARGVALAKVAGSGGDGVGCACRARRSRSCSHGLGMGLSLAAVNSPRSMVILGRSRLGRLIAHCREHDIRAKRVVADFAGHSPQIDALREELLEALAPIEPAESRVPLYSTVTGERIDTAELVPEYWYRGLRETVVFEDATSAAIAHGAGVFVEVSPHAILTPAMRETAEAYAESPDVGGGRSLRREEGGLERFVSSVPRGAREWCGGGFRPRVSVPGGAPWSFPPTPSSGSSYWLSGSGGRGEREGCGPGLRRASVC